MQLKSVVIALTLPLAAGCAPSEQSVLKWSPGKGIVPRVAVEVQWFKDNDYLSPETRGLGSLQVFSAVMDTFCGDSPELRREFSDWVQESNEHHQLKR